MRHWRNAIAISILLQVGMPLFAASEVVPGVHVIPGSFVAGSQPDGNTIVFTTHDGLIVVDSGRHIEHTRAIVDYARASGLPVKALINTHWHLDHIGGNALLRKEFPGLHVYASGALAEALKGFLANYRRQLVEIIPKTSDPKVQKSYQSEIEIIDSGPELAPDVVVAAPGTRTIDGLDLYLGLERNAVTAGDVWILDPASGVLVSGDLVTFPAPFLDTACPSRWKDVLDRLARVDFELLIPGHGPPLTRRQFNVWRRAFDDLLLCTSSSRTKDACVDGWVSGVSTLIPEKENDFTRKVMAYYVDVLRADPSEIAKLCGTQ